VCPATVKPKTQTVMKYETQTMMNPDTQTEKRNPNKARLLARPATVEPETQP